MCPVTAVHEGSGGSLLRMALTGRAHHNLRPAAVSMDERIANGETALNDLAVLEVLRIERGAFGL